MCLISSDYPWNDGIECKAQVEARFKICAPKDSHIHIFRLRELAFPRLCRDNAYNRNILSYKEA